ncbi:hypothetical protein GCM10011380_21640 [Sphingomonas metalli]|uniref:Uncharacterized protein n=1 Tax=Sphingomonas metalli TaxID=1779358 RepID=A0A916T502_9SPHN|nr:hypothetical protein GCM10011380_21640 [Sphingomonas metalli]
MRLVAEVRAGLDELLHGDDRSRHDVFSFRLSLWGADDAAAQKPCAPVYDAPHAGLRAAPLGECSRKRNHIIALDTWNTNGTYRVQQKHALSRTAIAMRIVP